ncbi:hypothetical protein B0A54_08890 [Friedmanniomyces endolithicus]|uniref:Zn(2)-C6 fungal-type domain-containing protein n=1 Tax=Friedmanniomyces endolithicus TaxID=329885 RepID=A0A4U0UWQ2_9PEZI|nr:transcription factor [Friedmanniomyces endolithicus]TKA40102.1 hypothetical protein B0A54_08890 [Friedmanniomyces endolithicus]
MINWVQEKPGLVPEAQTVSLYNETGARRRRTHQKSRKGCVNCKKKRVKCDEIRPGCGQCAEKKWPCEFQDAELPPKKAKRPTVPSVRRRQSTPPTSVSAGSVSPSHNSREWLHTQVLSFMERRNMPDRQLGDSLTYKRLDAVELVDHFIDYTDLWIGSSTSQGVIQRHGFEMALESEHLLHAMLACSAKHLSHLYPDVKKYDVAATLHYTRSLQAYSAQLCYDLEQGNANAMLATSGLLAKLTFINTPTMSANRPLAADNGPTAWIRSMQGVRTIMSTPRLRAQLEVGFMFPILQNFIELLERNDTRALLILLCWCAKLPLIEQWWTSVARIEFLRISAHLSSVDNPLVQQLLSLAAQCDVQSPRDAKVALGSGTIAETVAAVVSEEPIGRRKGP